MHLLIKKELHQALRATITGTALTVGFLTVAKAQGTATPPVSLTTQDPTMVFRSGLWKQWIYWSIPGP